MLDIKKFLARLTDAFLYGADFDDFIEKEEEQPKQPDEDAAPPKKK